MKGTKLGVGLGHPSSPFSCRELGRSLPFLRASGLMTVTELPSAFCANQRRPGEAGGRSLGLQSGRLWSVSSSNHLHDLEDHQLDALAFREVSGNYSGHMATIVGSPIDADSH